MLPSTDVAAAAIRRNPEVRVVNLSSVGAELQEGTGPIKGLHDAEAKLNAVTSNITHFRANYNVLTTLPTIAMHGAIYSTIPGSVSLAQVATRDIAAVAAELLLNGDRGRHVVDVFGPEEISFDRVAQILSDVLGVPVAHVEVPREQLGTGIIAGELSPDFADQLLLHRSHHGAKLANSISYLGAEGGVVAARRVSAVPFSAKISGSLPSQ